MLIEELAALLLGFELLCEDWSLDDVLLGVELELLGVLLVLLGEDDDWPLTELLAPGVVWAVPASGVWLCGGGVVVLVDGVALLSGVLVVLLGLAALELELLLEGVCELLAGV